MIDPGPFHISVREIILVIDEFRSDGVRAGEGNGTSVNIYERSHVPEISRYFTKFVIFLKSWDDRMYTKSRLRDR